LKTDGIVMIVSWAQSKIRNVTHGTRGDTDQQGICARPTKKYFRARMDHMHPVWTTCRRASHHPEVRHTACIERNNLAKHYSLRKKRASNISKMFRQLYIETQ
jgi:hypothetical protein